MRVPLIAAAAVLAALGTASPALAQGRGHDKGQSSRPAHPAHAKGPKHYAVSGDRAVVVTRDVLVRQGYEVVRVERTGDTQVIYYRRGNMGRGRGKGPLERMVVHTTPEHRVWFEAAPEGLLVDIDVRLKL